MANKVTGKEQDRGNNENRQRPEKVTDGGDNHRQHEINTHKGGRREGERSNQGHKSEPEHDVPSKRDETVEN